MADPMLQGMVDSLPARTLSELWAGTPAQKRLLNQLLRGRHVRPIQRRAVNKRMLGLRTSELALQIARELNL